MTVRTVRNSIAVAVALAFAFVTTACKKNVDPSAFDAGATAAPVVAADPGAAAAAAPSAPVAADSAAPLASLSPPATPPPAAGGAKKPTVKKNLPECDEARTFCNHPAVKTDKAMENLCTTKKQACFAKGGTL